MTKTGIGYKLTWCLLFLVLFHRFLIQEGAPSAIKYLLDVLNVTLFVVAIAKEKKVDRTVCYILFCSSGMLMIGTIAAVANMGVWENSLAMYIFDCRQILRFPMFLYSCNVLLETKDIKKLFDWFCAFHVANTLYIIYQFFTLKVDDFWMRGDHLNGFFGTETGGNTFVNVMMVVTTVIAVRQYIERRYGKLKLIFFITLNSLLAVLIEIKIFFLEAALIAMIYGLPYLRRPKKKTIAIVIGIVVLSVPIAMAMIQLLYRIYPWMQGTMSFSKMFQVTTSSEVYTGVGDINRLTCISDVIRLIYSGNMIKSLPGVGLGAANISGGVGTFCSRFEWTHYSWFPLAYIYVELGLLGTVLYLISLVLPLRCKGGKIQNKFIVRTMCATCLLMMVYNESLRTEAGYLIYFMVAVGMILAVEFKDNEQRKAIKYYCARV